jgi:Fic family protein
LSRADQALGRLIGIGQVLPNPHLVSSVYRRREAISSLAIEGTQTSLSDVLTSEAADVPGTSEVQEVRNYLRAFDHGLARLNDLPVSLRLVREIHAVLMEGVRGQERTPGEFRTSQNWIGQKGTPIETSLFVPPPVDLMNAALADWEKYLHEDVSIPPLVKCALVHYQFETIHPFLDGNGRIGRLLIAFYLVERGILPEPLLYVSPYFDARRLDYYAYLQGVRERGDFDAWFGFFLAAVESQALDAAGRAERLLSVQDGFKERLVRAKVRGRAHRFIDQLIANPFTTTTRVADLLDVTSQGAAYVVKQLLDAGILAPAGKVGRARVYVAEEVLEVLESPNS